MPFTYHSISFTPYPSTRNQILATCTCGWSVFGPSLEVQGKAVCHDLDIEPALTLDEFLSFAKAKVSTMTAKEINDMLREQSKSWAQSEAQWAKDFAEGKCERD